MRTQMPTTFTHNPPRITDIQLPHAKNQPKSIRFFKTGCGAGTGRRLASRFLFCRDTAPNRGTPWVPGEGAVSPQAPELGRHTLTDQHESMPPDRQTD